MITHGRHRGQQKCIFHMHDTTYVYCRRIRTIQDGRSCCHLGRRCSGRTCHRGPCRSYHTCCRNIRSYTGLDSWTSAMTEASSSLSRHRRSTLVTSRSPTRVQSRVCAASRVARWVDEDFLEIERTREKSTVIQCLRRFILLARTTLRLVYDFVCDFPNCPRRISFTIICTYHKRIIELSETLKKVD